MLSDLIPQSHGKILKMGNRDILLRLPLFSMLWIYEQGFTDEDLIKSPESIETYLIGALAGGMGFDKEILDSFDFSLFELIIEKENAKNLMEVLSADAVKMLLLETRRLSLPEPVEGQKVKGESKGIDYGNLRSLYCDIMGRPEREFWQSTLREIFNRWDLYAENKGWKEKAIEVEEFDDG